MNRNKIPSKILELLTAIANKNCRVESLVPQNRDSLDFHDIGVISLRDALYEAYLLGTKQH